MAPRRARGSRTLGLPALLLLLLLRPPATRGITCPPPVSVEHADIRVKSYSLYSRERYICNSGFKRKAGTSSLTECVLNKATNIAHWTTPSLKCIMAISTSTVLLCGLSAVSLLACYIKSRQTPPPASIEMEAMEALPVTGETSSRDEDLENCSHDL
ncbi:interleukin-15 receptor subunit alpha isoform X10 [Macaca fascicularis]|uniref:Interleukin-15 receptor subunit alpha n=1 Tax=Macaca mulatta TaxID=9544 RepID=A0MSN4_MACMU|nr:interleukin 15 receptor alpha variant 4 [Macaca mulatta]